MQIFTLRWLLPCLPTGAGSPRIRLKEWPDRVSPGATGRPFSSAFINVFVSQANHHRSVLSSSALERSRRRISNHGAVIFACAVLCWSTWVQA